MPYFSSAGWDCYALSMRAQGNSDCTADSRPGTLASNAADLATFVATLPRAPVAVGHSFGGLLIQRCTSCISPDYLACSDFCRPNRPQKL